MVWLPNGEKFRISLFVLTQSTNMTDTHRQTSHDDIGAFMHRITRQQFKQAKT